MILGGVAVAAVLYFFVSKPSSEERLNHNLIEAIGPDGVVSLDACDLSIVVEVAGQENSPIALTRLVLQADLRNYDFETVHLTPRSGNFSLRIDRSQVDNRMLAQAKSIVDAGGARVNGLFASGQTMEEFFEADGSVLSFRVMSEVVTKADGSQNLIAHEDAPDFFRFTESVEALRTPASYRNTTTFADGTLRSAETLLTGEVVAIPFLQFLLKSEEEAKQLAHAFHDYAAENECD